MPKPRYLKGKFAGAYLSGTEYVLLVVRYSRNRTNRNAGTRFVVPPLTRAILRFQKRFHGKFKYYPSMGDVKFVKVKYK